VATPTAATLLERERELAEVGDALTEARRGHGRMVLVEAPAGLGKTSLLRAASEAAAEAGFTCLRARATELERDFAYGCVRQLLEPVVAGASDAERLYAGAAVLSKPLFAPTESQPSGDGSHAVLHGLYWLLNNLADEGPVALSVDDLQWADMESLRFLNYLAPRLDGLPLAVLGAARSGESRAPDLARLAAGPETTVLRPEPLSAEATATLCESRLGAGVAPAFSEACREATGGNPFYLEALLRDASDQGFTADPEQAARVRGIAPAAVAQAVLLRLSGRPAAATGLVHAVAVLGDGASLGEAARLAELAEEEAARAADLLVALAILRPAEGLEFAHPIIREAVHGDIGPRERARAHARAAGILAARGASDERIAAQIAATEPAGDADRVERLRRVAKDALARGAPAAAFAWLDRALAEPPPPAARGEVLLELGSAALRAGRREAVDHLTAAVELIEAPDVYATSVRQLAHALTQSGDADRAVETIEAAVDDLERRDREQALLLEAELGFHAHHASLETRGPAMERLERHGDLAGASAGERLVLASLGCERARHAGSAGEAAGYLEDALAGWRAASEQQLGMAGLAYDLTIGLLAADALDVADDCLAQALADAQARGSIPELAYAICWRGWASLRRGAVGKAEADARTALELLTAHRLLGMRFALGLLVQALIEGDDATGAEHALNESGLGDEIPPSRASNYLLEARGLLRLAQGRTSEGLDDLLEFGRRDERWGSANPLASRWRSHASLALAAVGDSEDARQMAAADLERAQRWGALTGIGIALRATALLKGGPASVERLREAVEVLAGSPARLEHARALTDLGAALRRSNQRAEARHALEEGLELAERCSARSLAERARTELRAAGGRSSDPEATGVEQLTASERRVAELAAQGHSNPEIAQALFVTRKTVETHLGHVYRKLDVSGRRDLPRALAGR
jgi:DNA-binding CsgD family transcriptional regulator